MAGAYDKQHKNCGEANTHKFRSSLKFQRFVPALKPFQVIKAAPDAVLTIVQRLILD